MTVVADASILISLSTIGELNLLQERFPEGVLIP
jgi:predicted nucleic acid-binding protein